MLNIVLVLVFSIVMLFFMSYPAMKTADWLEAQKIIPSSWHKWLVILITILFSLLIGLFLRYA
ncbi:MAG: hypothetical protein DSZ10_03630 [Sulfurovum sp.]|nr:MAG: hypothetical protein DSZ10_03630 [Sulfurovum sp.]